MLTSSFIAHPKDTQMLKKKAKRIPYSQNGFRQKIAFSDYWDGNYFRKNFDLTPMTQEKCVAYMYARDRVNALHVNIMNDLYQKT